MDNQPDRLGNLIEGVISSLGQTRNYYGWRIVCEWTDIVGPEISRHARATRYAEGILTVVVSGDSWRQELEMELENIMKKIRTRPGGKAIKKIILRAGTPTEQKNGNND